MYFVAKGVSLFVLSCLIVISSTTQPTSPTFGARLKFTGNQVLDKASIISALKSQPSKFTSESEASADLSKAKNFNAELDTKDKEIDAYISKLQSDAGIFAGLGGLAELRQTIAEQQKSRDKYQQDFEKQLQQNTKMRGLFLVVLPNSSTQTDWDAQRFKSTAQQVLKARAVKELNDVFIQSVTQVINRSDVRQRISSRVSGTMTVEETPYEKRRAARQDYIILQYLNVSPLTADAGSAAGSASSSVSPLYLVNCKNADEVDLAIGNLGLNPTDENELRSKINEYTQKASSANISAKGGISNLWTALNKELDRLTAAIESTRKSEQEKTTQLRTLCATLYPAGVAASTLKDTIAAIEKKLEAQRGEITDKKREYEAMRFYLREKVRVTINDGSPDDVISEAILKAAQDLNTTFGNKAIYTEELTVVDKRVEDAKVTGAVLRRGKLKDVWVHVCIPNDDEYNLTMIGRFDVSNQQGGVPDREQPGPGPTPPPPSNLPAPIQKLINDMVQIQGGTFTMGCTAEQGSDCYDDEKPAHRVTVRSFKLGKYEVKQAQWRAVMGSDPPELAFKGCDNCPVERVSWNDIVNDFIPKLNQLTGMRFRLPSEAEWEYAARGGGENRVAQTKYSGSNDLDEVGWYSSNSGSKTRPVGQKEPNKLGLYDMSGNVYEWCRDKSHGNYQGAPTDGSAWIDGSETWRVVRGGSWGSNPRLCRVAYRYRYNPDDRYNSIGFRLAQD